MTAFSLALGCSAFSVPATGVSIGQRDAQHPRRCRRILAYTLLLLASCSEARHQQRGATVLPRGDGLSQNPIHCGAGEALDCPIMGILCARPLSPLLAWIYDATSACGTVTVYYDGISSQLWFSYLSFHASPPLRYLYRKEDPGSNRSYISSALSRYPASKRLSA